MTFFQTSPDITAVVVNWNHGGDLPVCLDALRQQAPLPKIILVDNASEDGSADWVEQHAPEVHLMRLDSNTGFARAFNLGATQTDSRWVASINPDIKLREGFFAALLEAGEQNKRTGMVAPKLLRADNPQKLDSTGLFLSHQYRPYDRGQMNPDNGVYDHQTGIFGACGAAALFRRAMLEDVAVNGQFFDEDFFAYYEDADLAWRAQLRGWQAIYAPQAQAEHVRGWGDTLRKSRHPNSSGPHLALRNRYLMPVKNEAWHYFIQNLPGMWLGDLPRLAYMLLRQPGALLGLVDFWRLLPVMLRKRKIIRAQRRVDDRELRHWFMRNWNE